MVISTPYQARIGRQRPSQGVHHLARIHAYALYPEYVLLFRCRPHRIMHFAKRYWVETLPPRSETQRFLYLHCTLPCFSHRSVPLSSKPSPILLTPVLGLWMLLCADLIILCSVWCRTYLCIGISRYLTPLQVKIEPGTGTFATPRGASDSAYPSIDVDVSTDDLLIESDLAFEVRTNEPKHSSSLILNSRITANPPVMSSSRPIGALLMPFWCLCRRCGPMGCGVAVWIHCHHQ